MGRSADGVRRGRAKPAKRREGGNAKGSLARLLGFPYFPLTPTFPWLGPLGAIPLPTKWTIQFGEPIPTDGYPPEAAEDPMLMFNLTDLQVAGAAAVGVLLRGPVRRRGRPLVAWAPPLSYR